MKISNPLKLFISLSVFVFISFFFIHIDVVKAVSCTSFSPSYPSCAGSCTTADSFSCSSYNTTNPPNTTESQTCNFSPGGCEYTCNTYASGYDITTFSAYDSYGNPANSCQPEDGGASYDCSTATSPGSCTFDGYINQQGSCNQSTCAGQSTMCATYTCGTYYNSVNQTTYSQCQGTATGMCTGGGGVYCGDGICNGNENATSCPADCGGGPSNNTNNGASIYITGNATFTALVNAPASPSQQTISLSNGGAANLNGFTLTTNQPWCHAGNVGTTFLAPNDSTTFGVWVDPLATQGNYTCIVTATDSNNPTDIATVPVYDTVVAPPCNVNAVGVDQFFGCQFGTIGGSSPVISNNSVLGYAPAEPTVADPSDTATPLPDNNISFPQTLNGYGSHYAIRFKGVFNFTGGAYQFNWGDDDGMRAFIDDNNDNIPDTGTYLFNTWWDQAFGSGYNQTVTLPAGKHQIDVEYYQDVGNAEYKLGWTLPVSLPASGACGSANGSSVSATPSTNLCSAGTASSVSGPTLVNGVWWTWTWTCAGTSNTASCSATSNGVTAIGVCGSANGQTFSSAPVDTGTNLCTTPYPSAVSGTGPWTWTCPGSVSTASCSANSSSLPASGQCGTSNNQSFYTAPTTNFCTVGSASAVSGTGPWTWTCTGSSSNASCNAKLKIDGSLGPANKTYPIGAVSYGSDTFCSTGTPSVTPPFPAPGTSVTWVCLGINGGLNSPPGTAINPSNSTKYLLTINPSIGGSVASGDGNISCGTSCSYLYTYGTNVTLNAVPASIYWQFEGWTGNCSGASPTYGITINGAETCSAVFAPTPFQYQEF